MAQLTFELYIDDDRYSVPTLHLVSAADQAAALAIARRLVAESPHHLGAEICLDGERLVGLGVFAVRRAIPEPQQP
jgi:hypothetical protein